MNPKPLCIAPFSSVHVRASADSTNTLYRPCCDYTKYNPNHKSVLDYTSSAELKLLQDHMWGDKLPAGCSSCDRKEKQGQYSLRKDFNDHDYPIDQGIVQLEMFPGNVCNLRCFMCNADSSTSLAAERKHLGWITQYKELDNADEVLSALDQLPALTVVSLIGGEFFLTKKNLEILDCLIKRRVTVRIVTNATIILPAHIEKLKQIHHLQIQISIDAVGDAYEFMRYPASWNEVNGNIHQLKNQLPNAEFNFNFVVQPLNIAHMIPAIDYANRLIVPIRLTSLIDPEWLGWKILEQQEKLDLVELLDQQLAHVLLTSAQKNKIASLKLTMQNTATDNLLRNEFENKMSAILAHRNISHESIRAHVAPLKLLTNK